MKVYLILLAGAILCCTACNTKKPEAGSGGHKKSIERKKPAAPITYHFENSKPWYKVHAPVAAYQKIINAINRADEKHVRGMDSILVPSDSAADIAYYLPFPLWVASLEPVDKIIFFSYATQSFGAYENGELIYTGATNMGRKSDPTPTGVFFTNWKAEQTTSTFNDEWDLKWNFNIENKLGVGWHQYEMPGYPASHSCLRLQEEDARTLYKWADQWVLSDKDEVKYKGTPVIVFGSYDFTGPRPWLQLAGDAAALRFTEKDIENTAAPYLQLVLTEQDKRKNGMAAK